MVKYYSFRTTRDTEWLDEILKSVPKHDRAKYIRELIIKGLNNNVSQTEHKPNTFVTHTEHKCNTNVSQTEHINEDENVINVEILHDEEPKSKNKKNISNFL